MNVKEKKNFFKVILVGGGAVSTGLKEKVFTSLPNHYSSITSLKKNKIKVIGIIEKNLSIRKLIKNKIKISCFKSLKEIKQANINDIFVICTPPRGRYNMIKELIDLNAKTIICEKPICIKETNRKLMDQRPGKSVQGSKVGRRDQKLVLVTNSRTPVTKSRSP